jgi:hypothetical protein
MLRKAETGPPKSAFWAALWWMEGKASVAAKLVCRNRPKWRPFKKWMGPGQGPGVEALKQWRRMSPGVSPCEVTVG